MKNAKGQMYAVGRKTKKVQVGYRELLLCSNCEGLISKYETEFKKTWMDTIPLDSKDFFAQGLRDGVVFVDIPDYGRFKLLHLSVLWKATVSGFKLDENISLGPYERQLAKLIRSQSPGNPGDFPFIGALSVGKNNRPISTVAPLTKGQGRLEGSHYYMMSYAYCDWIFVVGTPGPKWMVDLETKCVAENRIPLLVVAHGQSKSLQLWVKILRSLRK